MSLRRIVAALSIVSLAALGTATTASAAPPDKTNGIQHFSVVNTDPTDESPIVRADGVIDAVGLDVVTGEFTDEFAFPNGTLFVTHTPMKSVENFDEATCTFTFTERGSYTITGGTVAFADATGHGHYTVTGTVVGCDPEAPPTSLNITIDAKGPIHL